MTISSNYKGFSYGKLLQLEKKLPSKIEKIEKEISNLENRSDKHSERINSIEIKINEKIENKIGPRANDDLNSFVTAFLFVFSVGIATYFMYSSGEGLFVSLISSVFFFGLLIFAILANIYRKMRQPNVNRSQSEYDRRYNKLKNQYLKKMNLKQNFFDQENNIINKKISKLYSELRELNQLKNNFYTLKNRAKRREEKAKIFAFNKKAREGTKVIREDKLRGIKNKNNWKCPYCLEQKNIYQSEADHIHPINKGGLTTNQNIVLVCKKCNSDKKDLTLRVFCKKKGFNFESISNRLEKLGNDV